MRGAYRISGVITGICSSVPVELSLPTQSSDYVIFPSRSSGVSRAYFRSGASIWTRLVYEIAVNSGSHARCIVTLSLVSEPIIIIGWFTRSILHLLVKIEEAVITR